MNDQSHVKQSERGGWDTRRTRAGSVWYRRREEYWQEFMVTFTGIVLYGMICTIYRSFPQLI